MTSAQLLAAMYWMLEEAQSYIGAAWINDPHEAARRITEYFDELKKLDPERYEEHLKKAVNYGYHSGLTFNEE